MVKVKVNAGMLLPSVLSQYMAGLGKSKARRRNERNVKKKKKEGDDHDGVPDPTAQLINNQDPNPWRKKRDGS